MSFRDVISLFCRHTGPCSIFPPIQNNIPAEVTESIFGWLSGDRATLCILAQICRVWREPAQRVLFHTVEIDSAQKLAAFNRLCADKQSGRLANYVRELKIIAKGYPLNRRNWIVTVPMTLGPRLLGVKTLTLSGLQQTKSEVTVEDFPHFIRTLAAFSTVEELRLDFCTLRNIQQLEDLVFAFPLPLRRLDLDYLEISNGKMQQHDRHPEFRTLALGYLTIGRQCPIQLLKDWLVGTATLSTLDWLSIPRASASEIPKIGILLATLGSSIKYLRLGLEKTYTLRPGQ